MVQCQSKTI